MVCLFIRCIQIRELISVQSFITQCNQTFNTRQGGQSGTNLIPVLAHTFRIHRKGKTPFFFSRTQRGIRLSEEFGIRQMNHHHSSQEKDAHYKLNADHQGTENMFSAGDRNQTDQTDLTDPPHRNQQQRNTKQQSSEINKDVQTIDRRSRQPENMFCRKPGTGQRHYHLSHQQGKKPGNGQHDKYFKKQQQKKAF